MKKFFGMLIATVLATMTLGVYALSFGPDTLFLEADTESECQEMGGNFTEWYGEIYCTTTPSELLTKDEKTAINTASQKIITLIDGNTSLHTKVINMLETYKTKFMETKDMKRAAIVMILIQDMETSVAVIPETCSVWFDGCNTCQVMEDGELACTKMACAQQQEPTCKVHEKRIDIADHTEECTGVGPQTCLLISQAGQNDWTYFYDSIEGFEYIEGYQWTLLVEETHLDPSDVPADGSSISWKLKEIISIQAEIPETCTSWFDGCNTCQVMEDGDMACTLMYCEGEPMMPYCLDEGVDSTKATDYNSSRSNKSYNH